MNYIIIILIIIAPLLLWCFWGDKLNNVKSKNRPIINYTKIMNKQKMINLFKNIILIIALYISIYFLSLVMMDDYNISDYTAIGSISITIVIIYIWNKKINQHE